MSTDFAKHYKMLSGPIYEFVSLSYSIEKTLRGNDEIWLSTILSYLPPFFKDLNSAYLAYKILCGQIYDRLFPPLISLQIRLQCWQIYDHLFPPFIKLQNRVLKFGCWSFWLPFWPNSRHILQIQYICFSN